jgi:hypothetical protein
LPEAIRFSSTASFLSLNPDPDVSVIVDVNFNSPQLEHPELALFDESAERGFSRETFILLAKQKDLGPTLRR